MQLNSFWKTRTNFLTLTLSSESLLVYSSYEIILVIEFIINNHKNTTIMKLIYASSLLFLISCNSSGDKETIKMPGAYKMISRNEKTSKNRKEYDILLQLIIVGIEQNNIKEYNIAKYQIFRSGICNEYELGKPNNKLLLFEMMFLTNFTGWALMLLMAIFL